MTTARRDTAGASASDNSREVSGIAAGVIAGAVAGSGGPDPQSQHAYWRQHFRELQTLGSSGTYEDYAPAFEYGWESRSACEAKASQAPADFEEAEATLQEQWQQRPVAAALPWNMAREAVRAAWEKVEQAVASDEAKPSAR
jgi:hypothetical protein